MVSVLKRPEKEEMAEAYASVGRRMGLVVVDNTFWLQLFFAVISKQTLGAKQLLPPGNAASYTASRSRPG
jgi:hypothetical protein